MWRHIKEDNKSMTQEHISGRPPRLKWVYTDHPLYLVTFCTEERRPVLANEPVHEAFRQGAEKVIAFGNAVGTYVLMPDHVHVFVRIQPEGKLGVAVRTLKSAVSKCVRNMQNIKDVWQSSFFDHLLRSSESYSEKWEYVRNNPVRAGLVKCPEDWRFQGEMMPIKW
ncbi:MAG: hypothetical protein C0404_09710 [Verrucomicrobia bacterium]|nr:hypothetical protein [Verrucomicrobiota bacterium]